MCDDNGHIHTWGDWVVTTPPTCAMPGIETRTCTQNAAHTETRAVELIFPWDCEGIDESENFTDPRDGQSYRIVRIVDLTWMAENINFITADNATDSSWCYNDDADNCDKYGRLYNWNAAMKTCPNGWRLPDTTDWDYLGSVVGINAGNTLRSGSWHIIGNQLDFFGFSALPGGQRYSNSEFDSVGERAYWWSATEHSIFAHFRLIVWNSIFLEAGGTSKTAGFSVRCVRDN